MLVIYELSCKQLRIPKFKGLKALDAKGQLEDCQLVLMRYRIEEGVKQIFVVTENNGMNWKQLNLCIKLIQKQVIER